MASPALEKFNADVDAIPNGTALTVARKTAIKDRGKILYRNGAKETIAHLYKHAITVRDDPNETQARRAFNAELAANLEDIRDRYQDAWWLDIVEFR